MYDTEAKKGDEGWGVNARMTTYAGTGVGLILKVRPVREIVNEVRADAKVAMQHLNTATATAKL